MEGGLYLSLLFRSPGVGKPDLTGGRELGLQRDLVR